MLTDTDPKIEKMQIEILRRMPAWKKLAVMEGLNETVRALAVAGIKQRHPAASPAQIQRELAELTLGPELARKVYAHAK